MLQRFAASAIAMGVTFVLASSVAAQNSKLVQTTLNPLPGSVLIPASAFSSTFVGYAAAPDVSTVFYAGVGDLAGDSHPEVIFTGWTYRGWDATGTPPPASIYLLTTGFGGTMLLDAEAVLGFSSVAGTTQPRILDLNNDGRNDFFYLGHNESPLVPTTSEIFLRTGPVFSRSTLAGPKLESHNSNVGDFNGDGYVDIIASAYASERNFYAAELADGSIPDPTHPDWGYPMLYLNKGDGSFTARPVVTTDPAGDWLMNLGSGSASAMADFDGNGTVELVLVDAYQGANNWAHGDSWLITDITLTDKHAHGNVRALPKPYFDKTDAYAAYVSAFTDKSHDIKVDVVDVNNDSKPDIVVSVMLWDAGIGTQAGVFQILINQGNFEFTDATDTSLYNFFLGASGSHQTEFVDLNGDGFLDIFASDPYGMAAREPGDLGTWSTEPQAWATRMLINTGTGKFVQAMWNEFRDFTLGQRELASDPTLDRYDNVFARYTLPDGRIGFLTRQSGYTNTNGYVPRLAFFDYRAAATLSTGPNGTNPALQGEPGFSEYFYLTEYPSAAAAVSAGQYASGLAHYLAVGKAGGNYAFAPNATIVGSSGVDTLELRGNRSAFDVTPTATGYRVTDNVGRYRTLALKAIERVKFDNDVLELVTLGTVYRAPITLSTSLAGTVTWQRNGEALPGATGNTYTVESVDPGTSGIYTATNGTASTATVVGVLTTEKAFSYVTEFPNIVHPSGNVYDQLLLEAYVSGFTADYAQNQITRLSYIDLNDDIVQVEYSGPGTVSISLDGYSGPAAPINYEQNTNYMKGHARIVVSGANEFSNLTIFSVGRGTAVNQGLFDDAIDYDGIADVAFVAIQSSNGKFGGLRTANTRFWNTKGFTGVYAPGVQFTGPVYVHDINAQQDATPVLMIGSALGNTWITGGDLLQENDRALRVSGITQLRMADGVTSHYRTAADTSEYLLAKTNRARLERDGVDVTTDIVVNP